MNSLFSAIFLGFVQGLTEFLPVSSTAHLILAEKLIQFDASFGLVFDVALHAASALAVLWYFRADWFKLGRSFVTGRDGSGRLLLNIIVGTIPAGIAGILLEDIISTNARTLPVIVFGLIAGSILIGAAEWRYRRLRKTAESELRPIQGFVIGCFQALALIPGISRSGATISGGLLLGKNRVEAARFSFLLSTPIIVGAALKEFFDSASLITAEGASGTFLAGALASFISALAAIHIIMKLVERKTLLPFVVYRLALAAGLLVVIFL